MVAKGGKSSRNKKPLYLMIVEFDVAYIFYKFRIFLYEYTGWVQQKQMIRFCTKITREMNYSQLV